MSNHNKLHYQSGFLQNLTHWTFKRPLGARCMLVSPDRFSHLVPQPVMPTHWMT